MNSTSTFQSQHRFARFSAFGAGRLTRSRKVHHFPAEAERLMTPAEFKRCYNA